jgi:Leucine-rich repeat (LRR) protein
VALTRFMCVLPHVGLGVRQLTHTLQLPPAHAERYGGPHAGWLRDCLEYLPRLQCLIVDELPLFDHASLIGLRHPSAQWRAGHPNISSTFDLRLLDASGCRNATSTGLVEAFRQVPNLVSLDLSYTPAAKHESILRCFKYLSSLRVLNLSGLGLRDVEVALIADSIGSRLRSLDISNNHLTDASARILVEQCLKVTVVEHGGIGNSPWIIEHARRDGDLEVSCSENAVKHLRGILTEGFVGTLAIEDARDVGITHLLLSNNALTEKGVSELLRSGCLQVLDIGVAPIVMEPRSSNSTVDAADDLEQPGLSRMISALSEYASARLQYLRISHKLVTTYLSQEYESKSIDSALPLLSLSDATAGKHSEDGPSPNALDGPAQSSSRSLRQSSDNRLHPSMLPRVYTLVLTEVPTSTTDKVFIDRLIQYIKDAANEASIARQQAKHTYALPPGRSRALAEEEFAHSVFALRRIVLEMAPLQASAKKSSVNWRAHRSATEDVDSEAFWEAAKHDFSFFDSEESGVPDIESESMSPSAPAKHVVESKPIPIFDVVGEIAKFRKERKAVYTNLLQLDEMEPHVEGYWTGDVTVVRRPANADVGGSQYGRAGWYYG